MQNKLTALGHAIYGLKLEVNRKGWLSFSPNGNMNILAMLYSNKQTKHITRRHLFFNNWTLA